LAKVRFLVPNIVTALALCCGVIASALAMGDHVLEATWWVMYATIFDRLDGATARRLNAQSAFGTQFDSFSDFASFGLAPAMLYLEAAGGDFAIWQVALALIYVLSCAVRLGRFNVAEKEKTFNGVPSTLAGGVYAVALHLALKYELNDATIGVALGALLILFGGAMNASWIHYQKLGSEPSRFARITAGSLIGIAALLVAIRQLPEVIFFITGGCMITGPVIAAFSRKSH
jgi:CDP-diacylglycerol--serine O-phosphatidyltransferase